FVTLWAHWGILGVAKRAPTEVPRSLIVRKVLNGGNLCSHLCSLFSSHDPSACRFWSRLKESLSGWQSRASPGRRNGWSAGRIPGAGNFLQLVRTTFADRGGINKGMTLCRRVRLLRPPSAPLGSYPSAKRAARASCLGFEPCGEHAPAASG